MASRKKQEESKSSVELINLHDQNDQFNSENFNPLERLNGTILSEQPDPTVHSLGPGLVCETDTRGYANPQNRPPNEIMVDASEGFIPLWEKNRVLRWQFHESSLQTFRYPNAAKNYIRQLMAEAIFAWGDAAPIRFKEVTTGWDFEIEMSDADKCSMNGCTLASAFFPDGGRHKLKLYPKLFKESRKEQLDTFIHELGHVFGLRHFFANVDEKAWPSELFGEHREFSIMNYGSMSELTAQDKKDLKALYQGAWSGQLTEINGTPIVLFRPYHYAVSWLYSDTRLRI